MLFIVVEEINKLDVMWLQSMISEKCGSISTVSVSFGRTVDRILVSCPGRKLVTIGRGATQRSLGMYALNPYASSSNSAAQPLNTSEPSMPSFLGPASSSNSSYG